MRARAQAGDPGGRPRRRRRWWVGLLSALAVLAGAYFYFQYEIVDPLLKPLIETQLAQAVHSPVVIGSVRAGLTGNVVLNKVLLTVPGNPWESHIQVGQVSVEVQLYDLLFHKKPVEDCLESLSFIRPQITLVKNAAAAPPSPSAGLPNPPSPSASSGVTVPIPVFPVPKVSVRQGSFLVQADKTPRQVLTDLRFDASTANGTAWGLSLSAHSPETGGAGVVRFNGGFQPDGIKLRGMVNLNQWPLTSAGSILKETTGWDLSTGTINAESPVVFQLGKDLWYDAKADVNQATLKTPGPVVIAFSNINGRALIRPHEINLPGQITFLTGETRWQASGFVPLDGRPLSVRSSTDKLYLATVMGDILKLDQVHCEGSGTADLVVSGPLLNPVVTGSAQLGPSKVNQWPLNSLAIKGHFENQVLYFDSAKGKLLGGAFAGNGFSSILDRPDAPVSLRVKLSGVDAQQVATALGISQTQGKIDQELRFGGTRSTFLTSLSSTGQMDLTRQLRGSEIHYVFQNKAEYKNQKLTVSATLNDKSKLEAVFGEEAADWKLEKFSAVSGRKAVRLTGHGVIPKADDQPVQVEVTGKDLALEDLPIFNDQFPDITGKVGLDLKVGGTRKDLTASAHLSGEARLGDREPSPLELSLSWKEGQGTLDFEKLEVGPQFSVSGQLALDPDKPNDLKIAAEDIPIQTIAEIAGWNNPPEPLEGSVTGHLHLSGLKKNPIVEGDDIALKDVKAGDWSADKITASVDMSEGKLLLKKMRFDQGENFLEVNGSWDTNPQSGLLALRFSAKGFQLAKGPYFTGDLVLDAKSTDDPFWENWTGTLSSKAFTLTDLNKRDYHFTDFSMPTSCDDLVLKSRFKMGTAISGSTVLDLKAPVPTLQALLKIGPASLAEMPELTQFLPSGLKVTGNIAGEIRLKKGPLGELPMEGSLTVMNGSIQKYDFDKMELAFEGNKSKISPRFTLVRDQAQYSLSGTLSSAKSFWDPESSIDVTGPVKREKLESIVTLLGFNTETHRVAGEVSGDLTLTGTFSKPVFGFSVRGDELLYDNLEASSADLQFSYSDGKVTLGSNQITLPKGQIKIDQGSASLDPKDPGLAVLDLEGSTQDLPIGPFNFTSQIHLSGNLALEDKEDRPTFEGLVSVWETVQEPRSKSFLGGLLPFLDNPPKTVKTTPFDVALKVHHKVIEFDPLDNDHPQILGKVDLSQGDKILFDHLRLSNAAGSFLVDGNLDFNGPCSLVSDSKNVPIQEIGKWLWPGFPLSGTGSYHLVFEGSLDDPLFTISLSVMDGRVGDLPFDLLDGEVKSSNNTLFFGDEENPITLSRKGVFSFTLGGKMPLALTRAGWLKVRDRDMDVTAQMEKGDFGLVMMTGWPQKASGNMDFSAHIGGTLDNPDLNLDLDLAKCQLVPPMVAQSIDDLNGRIKVRHNKLAVEDLNGRIGQGRVFITSPPVDESKMVLVDFIPQYLDFRVQTIGNHGVWLSVPTIMRKGEWGEIYFYGQTPSDPLVVQGPLSSPVVSGTALLESGHFTFPPIEALDDSGKKIEYRELAGVKFDLKLVSGKNTWYSNDFNSNYLELKVDPGESIKIEGRDSDSTPEQRGIQCYGTASSSEGWLLYLSHKFTMENGWITISRGKAPYMWGRATDTLNNVDVISAGGVVKSDVNIWVDFKGTFGSIDFKLGSSPLFDPLDPDKQQKLLLSYIMFGRDMTGYTEQQLQQYYQQNYGQAASAAIIDTLNRFALNEATRGVRSTIQQWLGADIQLNGNPIPGGGADASGNSLSTLALQAEITKPINQKLSLKTDLGFNRGVTGGDLAPQGSVGMEYLFNNKLKATGSVGQNDLGQTEARLELGFHTELPDAIGPKKGDTTKPHFERFDIFPVGPGKFSLKWVTDKVTKCEVRVLDTDGQLVKDVAEKKNFDYYHDMILDGLAPNQDFQIQITAKDPNGNERVEAQKASAAFD